MIIIVQKHIPHRPISNLRTKEEKRRKGAHRFPSAISVGRAHHNRQLVKRIKLRAESSAALRYDRCMLNAQCIVEASIILTVFTSSPFALRTPLSVILVNVHFSASQSEIVGDQRPYIPYVLYVVCCMLYTPWINVSLIGRTREKLGRKFSRCKALSSEN